MKHSVAYRARRKFARDRRKHRARLDRLSAVGRMLQARDREKTSLKVEPH